MPGIGDRLQGKVAIVTGAASGFGASVAKLFVAHGAKVVVADLNTENGNRVVATAPDSMLFVNTDVTSAASWKKLVDETVERFGRVDILINNAGTSYKNKPTIDVTEAEFDKVFAVNVKSIFLSIQNVAPQLLKQASENNIGASIINISSIGATRPRPGLVWYNASKGAVSNATKGLAAEYGKYNIRVNAICPVLTSTGLFESFTGMADTPEARAKFLFNIPLGRLGDTEDVAHACLYLASDEAKFITGTCLDVDGGRSVG